MISSAEQGGRITSSVEQEGGLTSEMWPSDVQGGAGRWRHTHGEAVRQITSSVGHGVEELPQPLKKVYCIHLLSVTIGSDG